MSLPGYYGDKRDNALKVEEPFYNKTYVITEEQIKKELKKSDIESSPAFHQAFLNACAKQLPAPPHQGIRGQVRVVIVTDTTVYDKMVFAHSITKDNKLVWAYDASIY